MNLVELHLEEVLQLLLLSAPFSEDGCVAARLQSSALLLREVLVGQQLVDERDAQSSIHLACDLKILELFILLLFRVSVLQLCQVLKFNHLTVGALG